MPTKRTDEPPKSAKKATPKGQARKGTKADAILRLLRRPKGACIAELQKTTGWRPHSVRAALTGLRKQGHELVRAKDNAGITRYRIAGEG